MKRIAVVGTGGYAWALIQKLWDFSDICQVVAVTHNPARTSPGTGPCKDRGIPVFGFIDDLLSEMTGKCDAVVVPTPIHTHCELTKKCLEAGMHVLLEKPPVATIQQHDELLACSAATGKSVGVNFNRLYAPIAQQLKRDLSSGKYGRIKRVRSMAGWVRMDSYYTRSPWAGMLKADGQWVLDGTINNPLAHMLADDLYLASMDPDKMANPITVQAELYRGHDIQSEDTSSLRIITDEDVEIIYMGTLCPEREVRSLTAIDTEQATIEYDSWNKASVNYKDGRQERLEDGSDNRAAMLAQMIPAIDGPEPFRITLEICRPFTLAVNAAFDSSGQIYSVSPEHLRRFDCEESVKTEIKGISDLMDKAHARGKVFSEISAPWTRATKPIQVTDYKKFPSRDTKS